MKPVVVISVKQGQKKSWLKFSPWHKSQYLQTVKVPTQGTLCWCWPCRSLPWPNPGPPPQPRLQMQRDTQMQTRKTSLDLENIVCQNMRILNSPSFHYLYLVFSGSKVILTHQGWTNNNQLHNAGSWFITCSEKIIAKDDLYLLIVLFQCHFSHSPKIPCHSVLH